MTKKDNNLIGRKIVEIRKMNEAEMEKEGWEDTHGTAYVLVLDNGSKIYASQDDEGNGPGTLFGTNKKGEGFYIMQ
jgi:hypothetical protein